MQQTSSCATVQYIAPLAQHHRAILAVFAGMRLGQGVGVVVVRRHRAEFFVAPPTTPFASIFGDVRGGTPQG